MSQPQASVDIAPGTFIYHRRVQWADGDAAQVGYTGSQLEIFLEAIGDWFWTILEIDWYTLNTVCRIGSPYVHLDLDFSTPVRPGEQLRIAVELSEVGRSSMHFALTALDGHDQARYVGSLVHVMIDHETMQSVVIPSDLHASMLAYMQRNEN